MTGHHARTRSGETAAHPLDILFVNPAHHGPDYYSPIGVNMLSTLAREAGFASEVLDFQQKVVSERIPWPEGFLNAAAAELARMKAKVFGFTIMNVGFPWALELASIVRHLYPDSVIVFGGPHATLLGSEMLQLYGQIDIVVRNEGETVIVPLLQALLRNDDRALSECPNLLFRSREGGVIKTKDAPFVSDLDALPLMILDDELVSKAKIISVEAGRGCPYHCTFCSSHAIWTRAPRFKSPKRLVDEALKYIQQRPTCGEQAIISYEHDDFLSNRPLFYKFTEYKATIGANFRYGITTRINHLTEEVIDLLARSGCVSVFMGLETGSEHIQKSSFKHLNLSKIAPTIRRLRARRIHISTNFIIGFPEETYSDVVASFKLITALSWLGCTINISMMCPEPGSAIHASTPPEDYRLLSDGQYGRELRRGGIPPESLNTTAQYHLLSIANPNYDIIEMAGLCGAMQLLMSKFPYLLHEIFVECGSDMPSLLDRVWQHVRTNGEIDFNGIEDFALKFRLSQGARSGEFLRYEIARAAIMRGEIPRAHPSDFQLDMPHAYFAALDRVAETQWEAL